MPAVGIHHRKRAQSELEMADASATNMARMIHSKLAEMHLIAAEARLNAVPSEAAAD